MARAANEGQTRGAQTAKGGSAERGPYRRYPAEFRARVVHEARMCGSVRLAGEKFGVAPSTAYYWVRRAEETERAAERQQERLEALARSEAPLAEPPAQLGEQDLAVALARFHHGLLNDLLSGRCSVRDKLRAYKILFDEVHKPDWRDDGKGQLDELIEAVREAGRRRRGEGADGE